MEKMTSTEEMTQLNPEARTFTIGKRALKPVTVYPLSMGDQIKFIGTIAEVMAALFKDGQNLADVDFLNFAKKVIEDNLEKVIMMVTDLETGALDDITNSQGLELIDLIFEMNYGLNEKKVRSLLEKATKLFQLQRLSPVSSGDIPSTDLKTSSESLSEKEE